MGFIYCSALIFSFFFFDNKIILLIYLTKYSRHLNLGSGEILSVIINFSILGVMKYIAKRLYKINQTKESSFISTTKKMSTVKLVAVTGITGKQGGAVARKLLELGHRVRGLTRNASSPSAIKLAQSGIEMVSADMEDVDSLKAAFAGADSVFVVTTPGVFNAKV